jgi:hypothetical protein
MKLVAAASRILAAAAFAVLPAQAQNVKITPVGSHPGELCERPGDDLRGPDRRSYPL